MDDSVLVEIINGSENLLDGLRGILLGELPLFADTVEQLSTGCELGDDIELVLGRSMLSAQCLKESRRAGKGAYP